MNEERQEGGRDELFCSEEPQLINTGERTGVKQYSLHVIKHPVLYPLEPLRENKIQTLLNLGGSSYSGARCNLSTLYTSAGHCTLERKPYSPSGSM